MHAFIKEKFSSNEQALLYHKKLMDPMETKPIYDMLHIQRTLGLSYLRKLIEMKNYINNQELINGPKLTWFTINPKDSVDSNNSEIIEKLKSQITKLQNYKWVKQLYYSYEQRSETPNKFHGIHLHGLLFTCRKEAKAQGHINQQIRRLFGTLCGTNKAIDIRTYPITFKQDKLDYLNGLKYDPDKKAKIDNDILFRQKYNLEQIYKSP